MVQKVKFLRVFVFLIVFIVMLVSSFLIKGGFEGNLIKTIMPSDITKNEDVIPLYNKFNSDVRVIFESKNEEDLKKVKEKFILEANEKFLIKDNDFSNLIKKYSSSPTNFLSKKTKKLLKDKKYDEIYNNALMELYNPFNIQIVPYDKDPYFLLSDFLLSLKPDYGDKFFDDKYYDCIVLKLSDNSGLAPDNSNILIEDLIKIKERIENDDVAIYLSGSPVHSYYTSKSAKFDINLICILSTLLTFILTYLSFKNLKIIIPVFLSLIFGITGGIFALKIFFGNIQLLALVFATAIIGLGVDYSFHYFFSKNEKGFIKNLTTSLISTAIPFIIFYMTGIELLREIAVFIVFALICIYLFVLFLFPCFKLDDPVTFLKPNLKFLKIIFFALTLLFLFSGFKLKFNDCLTSFYVPNYELMKSEKLYERLSNGLSDYKNIIILKGENYEDIIQKNEKVSSLLDTKEIKYLSVSDFVKSENTQIENYNFVHGLYNSNLDKIELLTKEQKQNLKNETFKPVEFSAELKTKFDDFFLNDKTSIILSKEPLNINGIFEINLTAEISKFLKSYRVKLLKILPLACLCIFFVLSFIYKIKTAFKISLPLILGLFPTVFISCMIARELNLFSIISLFLILGFTADYFVFKTDSKNSSSAVFISFCTTSFSFLLLSFSSFKLLSSISLVLFIGILFSYVLSCLVFKK